MVTEKNQNTKENSNKINDLKIELLKQPTKKKNIKRQIARILTQQNKEIKLGEKK